MNRPYIICHMSVSIDGKITGEYTDSPVADKTYKDYENINRFIPPQAWVNGRITVDENFTFYKKPNLKNHSEPIPILIFLLFKTQKSILWPLTRAVNWAGRTII